MRNESWQSRHPKYESGINPFNNFAYFYCTAEATYWNLGLDSECGFLQKKFCLFSELLICSRLLRRLSFLGPYDYALVCIIRVQLCQFGILRLFESALASSSILTQRSEPRYLLAVNRIVTQLGCRFYYCYLSMCTSSSSAQVPNSPKANDVLPPFPSLMNHITPAYLNTVYIYIYL